MCLNPIRLETGQTVGCRECWQCRAVYTQDWVGRCIAESRNAAVTRVVTLTYEDNAENDVRSQVLTYSDVQKWLKRLRKEGYPLRYLCAGEYGTMKGRAHWHIVLFFKEKAPPHSIMKREKIAYWDHGYSYWEKPSPDSLAYVCKYIQKDKRNPEKDGHFAMSKKPPLGDAHFRRLAHRYVRNGLAPQTLEYSFGDVRDKKDKPVKFMMRGTTAKNFLAEFVEAWELERGGHIPSSELVETFLDGLEPDTEDVKMEPRAWKIQAPERPLWASFMGFDEKRNIYYAIDSATGERLYWTHAETGEMKWLGKIGARADAESLILWQEQELFFLREQRQELRQKLKDVERLKSRKTTAEPDTHPDLEHGQNLYNQWRNQYVPPRDLRDTEGRYLKKDD